MSIEPTTRILVTPPKDGMNPNYLSVSVADEEAREAVNKFKDEVWAKGDNIPFGDGLPISEGKLHGRFVVNPCFKIVDIIELIESAVA